MKRPGVRVRTRFWRVEDGAGAATFTIARRRTTRRGVARGAARRSTRAPPSRPSSHPRRPLIFFKIEWARRFRMVGTILMELERDARGLSRLTSHHILMELERDARGLSRLTSHHSLDRCQNLQETGNSLETEILELYKNIDTRHVGDRSRLE